MIPSCTPGYRAPLLQAEAQPIESSKLFEGAQVSTEMMLFGNYLLTKKSIVSGIDAALY